MEQSQLMQYINENNLILIPILYILGMYIKMTKLNNRLIPWVLLVIAVALTMLSNGVSVNSLLQGILLSAVPTYANQLVKQTVLLTQEKSILEESTNDKSEKEETINNEKDN